MTAERNRLRNWHNYFRYRTVMCRTLASTQKPNSKQNNQQHDALGNPAAASLSIVIRRTVKW